MIDEIVMASSGILHPYANLLLIDSCAQLQCSYAWWLIRGWTDDGRPVWSKIADSGIGQILLDDEPTW